MYENNFPNKRFKHTSAFLQKHITTDKPILDLGVENPFSKLMKDQGYSVENTHGEDLDLEFPTELAVDGDKIVAKTQTLKQLEEEFAQDQRMLDRLEGCVT